MIKTQFQFIKTHGRIKLSDTYSQTENKSIRCYDKCLGLLARLVGKAFRLKVTDGHGGFKIWVVNKKSFRNWFDGQKARLPSSFRGSKNLLDDVLKVLLVKKELTTFFPSSSLYQLDYWKIIPPGGGPASYLVGTFHNGLSWKEIPLCIQQGFNECEEFVGESSFKKIDFENVLNREHWELCKKKTGKTSQELKALFPRELLKLLTDADIWSMDMDLEEEAIRMGKPRHILDDTPEDLSIDTETSHYKEWVEKALADPAKFKKGMDLANATFRKQAEILLRKDAKFTDNSSCQAFGQATASERNLHWQEKLFSLITKKSQFIAVGAGHLYGVTPSVQELLEKKGCKCIRLRSWK
jgi:uncharacterized protein YbaP (TraB family)